MRVIAGEWRGRKLVAPAGLVTRPTSDRVRETLFSMLASRLGSFEDLRVADLYAGSGAFGLEALSRGAAFACFVEQNPQAAQAIRANIETLGAQDRTLVLVRSVTSLPPQAPFDLVFADPPYSAGSGTAAVEAIASAGWAAPGAWLAVETERGEPVDGGAWTVESARDVGRARLTLTRAVPSP